MHTEWLLRIDRWLGGVLLLFCRRWRRRNPPATVRTILIFKFMGGGSITVAGPLLLALRRKHPDARLVLVCTSQVAAHAELLGLLSKIKPPLKCKHKSPLFHLLWQVNFKIAQSLLMSF